MVLQRFEGLSDSEVVDRLHFDLRYKWVAGLGYDAPSFDATLLVDMRARLRNSSAPDRIFEAVLDVAKKANLVGKKRIVDSTALYDAVATQDTVTLVRSAIVGVLRGVDEENAQAVETRRPVRHHQAAPQTRDARSSPQASAQRRVEKAVPKGAAPASSARSGIGCGASTAAVAFVCGGANESSKTLRCLRRASTSRVSPRSASASPPMRRRTDQTRGGFAATATLRARVRTPRSP
jgi:hypothetical protein